MTIAVATRPLQVVVVSGLSGAGKASILRALEDIGYEAIDNPPLQMFEDLVAGAQREARWRLAIGIDARTHGFDAALVLATLARLRGQGGTMRLALVYAWAEDEAIRRRYTQTRRRHPLAGDGRLPDGIRVEQVLTQDLRAEADLVIDTTDLPLPELRRLIEARFGAAQAGRGGLSVSLVSFAFPAGLPREADMVFDVRFLANPHYVSGLRELTGLDPEVAAFVEADPGFPEFYDKISDLVSFVLPRFVGEGKKYVTFAVGCTGGRHRSVRVVERLAAMLSSQGWGIATLHRELGGFRPDTQCAEIEAGAAEPSAAHAGSTL